MTYKEIHDVLKDNLISGILCVAHEAGGNGLIIPGAPEINYESGGNGWCNDCLGAICSTGDAYFVCEESDIPEGYDFEEDYDGIVCASMYISDIMLIDLAQIAELLKTNNKTVRIARRFKTEVMELINLLPEDFTGIRPVEINVADEDGFFHFIEIEKVSNEGAMDKHGNVYKWETDVPIDDICTVIDHL